MADILMCICSGKPLMHPSTGSCLREAATCPPHEACFGRRAAKAGVVRFYSKNSLFGESRFIGIEPNPMFPEQKLIIVNRINYATTPSPKPGFL
jgi:hypothetical protein